MQGYAAEREKIRENAVLIGGDDVSGEKQREKRRLCMFLQIGFSPQWPPRRHGKRRGAKKKRKKRQGKVRHLCARASVPVQKREENKRKGTRDMNARGVTFCPLKEEDSKCRERPRRHPQSSGKVLKTTVDGEVCNIHSGIRSAVMHDHIRRASVLSGGFLAHILLGSCRAGWSLQLRRNYRVRNTRTGNDKKV
jgi:hypothetical protein